METMLVLCLPGLAAMAAAYALGCQWLHFGIKYIFRG